MTTDTPAMMERRFVWGEDREYGSDGWMPTWQPDFNSSTGSGIAHDLMEHFDDSAGAGAECVAMGVMLHGRGLGGWFSRIENHFHPNVSWHLGQTLSTILMDEWSSERGERGDSFGLPKYERQAELDYGAECEIDEALEICKTGMKSELRHCSIQPGNLEIHNALRNVRMLLRKGFRQAESRFPNHNSWQVAEVFDLIAKKADRVGAFGDFGDTLIARLNPETLDFELRVERAEDEYQDEDES